MFSYLKALAARLAGRGFLSGLPPSAPDDPHVGVREPRKRGPSGKSAAVALAEPEERTLVRAYGQAQTRSGISNNPGPYEG
jgi:hypothetical protein